MAFVKCRTLYNGIKYVPADVMIQRPSVYGIILHDANVLLVKAAHTSKYVLPGGGLNKGEAIETALIREVIEETGIEEDLVSASWVDARQLTSVSFQTHGETTMNLLHRFLEM
jgi:8-oxo-dGTP pyrophosphatase MutT (NUDIX family)